MQAMQFYLNGYRPGDPLIADPHPSVAERSGAVPEDVDVLIVGCGPAGLVLAAQMARFTDIRTAVIAAKTVRSRLDRPTESPVAPSRCSRHWGSPVGWSARPIGSTRSASGDRTPETRRG